MKAQQKKYDEQEIEQAYKDMLDEAMDGQYLVDTYGAARILKEIDPTDYNVRLSDYESKYGEVWICGECDEEYENEEDAEACCKE